MPFLFFYKGRSDYEFVINWLRERPGVRRAAILAQFYRTCVEFEELLGFMRSIAKDVGRPLDFIVVGAASGDKITRILAEFKTATIATSQPVIKAIKGVQLSDELTHQPLTEGDRAPLVGQNIEQYRIFCERISGHRKAAVRVKRQDAKKLYAADRFNQVNTSEAGSK